MENEKNKYEAILILKNTLSEKEIDNVLDFAFFNFLPNIIELEHIDKMGIKCLAYDIDGCREGYYVVVRFSTKFEKIADIERNFRIKDEILKFIIVKVGD